MEKFDFYIPTRVLFGPGKLDELAAAKLPGQKALIVTTAGKSVKKYGYLDRVVELLKKITVRRASCLTRCCPIRC